MDGRTVIVTGGARGMGAATARLLAAEGGTVIVGDVLLEEARALAGDIERAGGRAVAASLDVTSQSDWDQVAALATELGGADALVNNAGISRRVGILETERSDWDQVLAVNLTGCMLGIRAVGPGMCERGRGSIVNISSIAGRAWLDQGGRARAGPLGCPHQLGPSRHHRDTHDRGRQRHCSCFVRCDGPVEAHGTG